MGLEQQQLSAGLLIEIGLALAVAAGALGLQAWLG